MNHPHAVDGEQHPQQSQYVPAIKIISLSTMYVNRYRQNLNMLAKLYVPPPDMLSNSAGMAERVD